MAQQRGQHGRLPLAHYGLHQHVDASLVLRLPNDAQQHADAARHALRELLGDLPLTLDPVEGDDKILQYSSNLDDDAP